MSKKYCKEDCDFLYNSLGEQARCIIYDRDVDNDDEGYLRLKKCVRESHDYKIRAQAEDLRDFYDSFVCEMDIMFDNLFKLIKGEEKDG